MIYNHDGKQYDISKLDAEGQRAFQLLAIAEEKFHMVGNDYVIAQAATVALHTKLQEFLSDDALLEEDAA